VSLRRPLRTASRPADHPGRESLIHLRPLEPEAVATAPLIWRIWILVLDPPSRAERRAAPGQPLDLLAVRLRSAPDSELLQQRISAVAKSGHARSRSVADYPPTRKRKLRREWCGFYLPTIRSSSSPAMRLLTPIGLAGLERQADKARVECCGDVAECGPDHAQGRSMPCSSSKISAAAPKRWCSKTICPPGDNLMVMPACCSGPLLPPRRRVQLIVDDCRVIGDVQLLWWTSMRGRRRHQRQHQLRECLCSTASARRRPACASRVALVQ